MKQLSITEETGGQRLDKFLFKYFNTAPKSFVYKMLRKKRIKYNGKKAEGSELLQSGDTLQLYLSEETMDGFMEEKQLAKAKRHFGILYEDDNLLVTVKPAGLLSHPESPADRDTLIDQILYYLQETGQYQPTKESTFTPAICNRLDRNTGGIVLAGKTLQAVQEINAALANKTVDKFYVTMVKGVFSEEKELFGYHVKEEKENQVRVYKTPVPGAKKIITKVKPLADNGKFTLLQIQLITGKSHQIRAHLKSMGYPVVGDRKYGDGRVNRYVKEHYGLNNQFLFAYRLVWHSGEGVLGYLKDRCWTAPWPEQLEGMIGDYFGTNGLLREAKES